MGRRKCDKDIFEDGIRRAQFIHLTTSASYRGLQPAQRFVGFSRPYAYVQTVTERLHVFDGFIVVCDVTKKIQRRAAQFKDAIVEPRPQIRRRIFGDDFSALHKTNTMAT